MDTTTPSNRPEWTELSREIAARVRALRKLTTFEDSRGRRRMMSQSELDRLTGLGAGMLSRIESGERGRWTSVDTVCRLALALEVPVGFLVTGKLDDPDWTFPIGLGHRWTSLSMGARVKALREATTQRDALRRVRPMRRSELERLAELGGGIVTRLENDERGKNLSVDTMYRVALALRVPVGLLITGKRDDPTWRPPPGYDAVHSAELSQF